MTLRLHVNLPDMRAGAARRWRDAGLPRAPELRRLLRAAAGAALRDQEVTRAELSLTLLDDHAMRALNRDYLQRDRPTDVIAFSLGDGDHDAPFGDVYLGVERALAQAAELDVPPGEELVRLAVHGTLHVLGHDHPEDDSRVRSPMWRAQERIVRRVLSG